MSGRITTPFFDKICGKTKKKNNYHFQNFVLPSITLNLKQALTSSASGSVGWLAASIMNLALISFAFSLLSDKKNNVWLKIHTFKTNIKEKEYLIISPRNKILFAFKIYFRGKFLVSEYFDKKRASVMTNRPVDDTSKGCWNENITVLN